MRPGVYMRLAVIGDNTVHIQNLTMCWYTCGHHTSICSLIGANVKV